MGIRHRKHHSTRLSSAALVIAGFTIGLLFITPAGAHISDSVDHLFNVHIKPRLANPGTINGAGNPADWTKLKNVPAGFADGVDATTEGHQGPRLTSCATAA
jgi:hypothetical protein